MMVSEGLGVPLRAASPEVADPKFPPSTQEEEWGEKLEPKTPKKKSKAKSA